MITVETQYLDQYSYLDSPIHRLPASMKLAAAIAVVFFTLAIFFWVNYFFALLGLALLVIALVARLPFWGLFRKIRWMLLVILVLAAGQLLREDGLALFIHTAARAGLCLLAMAIMTNTTRFTDLLQVISDLGTPPLLVTTLALMYRYLFVLGDEMHRMKRARVSRTFVRNKAQAWKLLANVIAHLFARCADRAQRIHACMCARGWQ